MNRYLLCVTDSQSKYGNNRNLWRRIYPVGSPRRAPQTVSLVDPQTNLSYSLDLQQTIRHRDYFQIRPYLSGPLVNNPVLGEYDEGLIYFLDSTSATGIFNFTFTNSPIVVLTMENVNYPNTQNVVLFAEVSFNNHVVHVQSSAPLSGTIRYRAAYAPSYPYYFTSSFAPLSGTFRASAGSVIGTGESFVTASWASLNHSPVAFYSTPLIDFGATSADVFLTNGTLTNASAPIDVSAPIDSSTIINFLAVE